jgi:hypothetical protein
MLPIDWSDLEISERLNDRDVITVRYEDIDPNTSEFVIELARHKNWWKGIQLLDNTDGQMGFIEVENGTKSAGPLAVPSSDIKTGGRIILWKAKTFGVHTPMYVLANIEHVKGKRVTFRWVAD